MAAVAIEAGRRWAEGLAVHIYSYLDFQNRKGPLGSLSPAPLPALASGETRVQRGEETSSGSNSQLAVEKRLPICCSAAKETVSVPGTLAS